MTILFNHRGQVCKISEYKLSSDSSLVELSPKIICDDVG